MPNNLAFGWLIEQNIECNESRDEENAKIVSLNFVAPWYGDDSPTYAYNKPAQISFDQANQMLMFACRVPWAVEIESWCKIVTSLTADTHAVTPVNDPLHTWDSPIHSEKHIRGLLMAEFDKEAAKCTDLFSHDAQHMENGRRSYAHAVKDLSTFPVLLSRDILQATRSYSFLTADVTSANILVPKELSISTTTTTVKFILIENEISMIGDSYRLKYRDIFNIELFYIFIQQRDLQTNSNVSTTISTSLTSSPQQVRASMAQVLNPLAMLAKMLECTVIKEKTFENDLKVISDNLVQFANEIIIRSLGLGASHDLDCVFTQILIAQYDSADSAAYINDLKACISAMKEAEVALISVEGIPSKEGNFLTELVTNANLIGKQWFGEFLEIETVKTQAAQLVKEWDVFNKALKSSTEQTEKVKIIEQIVIAKTALAQVFRQLDQEVWSVEDAKSGKLYSEWLWFVWEKLKPTDFTGLEKKESFKKLLISQTLKHHDSVYLRLRPLSRMDRRPFLLNELRLFPSKSIGDIKSGLPENLRNLRRLLSSSMMLTSSPAILYISQFLIKHKASHKIVFNAVNLLISKHHDTEATNGERTEPKLTISLDTDIGNQKIRGYAIALYVGAQDASNTRKIAQSEWITDRAIFRKGINWNLGEKRAGLMDGDKLLRAHGKFGGDNAYGQNITHFEYPSHIALESQADKDIDAIDLAWPTEWELPLIGYGLSYQSVATALGNAGLVLDQSMRLDADPFSLKQVQKIEDARKSKEYTFLSRVELPSPVIKLDRNATGGILPDKVLDQQVAWIQEASSQSMAAQRQKSEKQQQVNKSQIYLIKPKGESRWKSDIPSSITLEILPHSNTPLEVIEYWLNADIVRKKLKIKHAIDPLFKSKTESELIEARKNLLRLVNTEPGPDVNTIKSSTISKSLKLTHPAIRRCAVRLTDYFAGSTTMYEAQFDAKNTQWDIDFIFFKPIRLDINYSDKNADKNSVENLQNQKVFVQSGSHIKIEVFYLIDDQWFTNDTARLHEMYQDTSFKGYRASTPYDFWVECLPIFNADEFKKQATFLLNSINVVKSKLDANLLIDNKVVVPAIPATPATWFDSVELNQGFYHWTGIPATLGLFDKMGSPQSHMAAWLPNYIGTQAAKLVSGDDVTHKNYRLKTQIISAVKWEIADGVIEPVVLAQCDISQNLNAQHGFYEVALKPRFESLYEPTALVDLKEKYSLKALKSFLIADNYPRQEAEYRLQSPVPFSVGVETESYGLSSDLQGLRRVASGAILTSTEAFNDTSPSSTLGGIAERIECSVIATRYKGVSEFGINPIFHKKPTWVLNGNKDWGHLEVPHTTGSASVPMDWDIEVSPFAGLTNDIGQNAMVIGSQLVVRPIGADVQRYWAMAKVHIRRWLEPTLVAQSLLLPIEATINNAWKLPRRKVGKEWIPKDFCITIPARSDEKAVKINIKGDKIVVNICLETGTKQATRFLASWHKDEWGNTATPLWSLQVVRQVLHPLDANTMKLSYNWISDYTFDPYTLLNGVNGINEVIDKSELTLHVDYDSPTKLPACEARVFIASDYSAPLQLTFMGSHLREQQLSAFEYSLEHEKSNPSLLKLYRTNISQKKDDKKTYHLGYEKIVRDLIVHPLRYTNYESDQSEKQNIDKFEQIDESGQLKIETGDFDLLFVYKIETDAAVVSKSTRVTTLHSAWAPYIKGENKEEYHLCFKQIVGKKIDSFFIKTGTNDAPILEPLYEAVLYKFQAPQSTKPSNPPKSSEPSESFDKFTNFDELFKQMFVESTNPNNEAPSIRQLPIYQEFELISDKDKWVKSKQAELKVSKTVVLKLPHNKQFHLVLIDLFDDYGWHIRDYDNWLNKLSKLKPANRRGSSVAVTQVGSNEKWLVLRVAGGAEWCRLNADMTKAEISFMGKSEPVDVSIV